MCFPEVQCVHGCFGGHQQGRRWLCFIFMALENMEEISMELLQVGLVSFLIVLVAGQLSAAS